MLPATPSSPDFATLDLLQEGVWVADASDQLVFVNAAMARIAGVDARLLTGQSLHSFPEGTVGHFLGFFNRAKESLRPCEYECAVVTPSGRATWQGGWLAPLVEQGLYAGMICTVQDISRRMHMQQQLESSEQRYRAVVEDQTEVISRVLPDGTLVFVNEVYCRLFGKTVEELVGTKWYPMAHPGDVPMIEAKLREMTPDNPVVVVEARVVVAGGEECWMQFVNRGFFHADGTLRESQSVGRDITSLKRVQDSLRKSEERLEMALAGSGLGCLDMDVRAGKMTADRRISEMLGYTIEQLEERLFWRSLLDPRDRPRFERDLAAHLRGDTAAFRNEHRLRHKEGHWVTVEARSKVVQRDPRGEPLRMVGTLLDITLRKRLDEEGVDLLKQIETLIRESTSSRPTDEADNRNLASLTRREVQILGMIAEGLTSAQIGRQLNLATNTVGTHRQNLMSKLDLHTAAEVTRFAIDHGLIKKS